MKNLNKRKTVIMIMIIFAIIIIIADLLLFWTSMQDTGVGSGFSRYWRTQQSK